MENQIQLEALNTGYQTRERISVGNFLNRSVIEQRKEDPPFNWRCIEVTVPKDLSNRNVKVAKNEDGQWLIVEYTNDQEKLIKVTPGINPKFKVELSIEEIEENEKLKHLAYFYAMENTNQVVILDREPVIEEIVAIVADNEDTSNLIIDDNDSLLKKEENTTNKAKKNKKEEKGKGKRDIKDDTKSPSGYHKDDPKLNTNTELTTSTDERTICQRLLSCVCCCGFFRLSMKTQIALLVAFVTVIVGLYYNPSYIDQIFPQNSQSEVVEKIRQV